MKPIFLSLSLVLAALFSGCARCGYNYCMEGAPEFVMDSYRIKQGKFSILEMEGNLYPPLPCEYLMEYEDRIDEDDVLAITLLHLTRDDLVASVCDVGCSIGYRVVDGRIRLPGQRPLCVRGLTLDEARAAIQRQYDGEIASTEIFIEYSERRHSNVELIGEVCLPNVPVNGRTRLFEVLSLAGVGTGANLFRSYVVREGVPLPVDLYRLVHDGDMSQNIVMRPKDKIYIANPMESKVMVMGEVGLPSVIPVPYGSITLREAITAAGGIPYTGDKGCIQVIRGDVLCPKIYRLSWNHIAYLPNDSLLLMPGDTVYISEKPITAWNRFIEQLLPSSLLIDLGVRTGGLLRR